MGNTVFFLHRMRRFPESVDLSLDAALPVFEKMPLVDPSRSWLLQVSLYIVDGANPELVNRGLKELETVKSRLTGVVNLSVPERLSMDTRAR
jgi:Med18 protein